LLVAFLAVVLAFIGSTVWAQRGSRGVSAAAIAISRDAAPEIETLTGVRVQLRLLEAQVLRSVAGVPFDPGIGATRRSLDDALSHSQALAGVATERATLARLQDATRAFGLAAQRALDQAREGNHEGAVHTVRHDLRQLADEADDIAAELVRIEAGRAREAAVSIEAGVARTTRLAFELDLLCAGLAMVAALLALRAVRALHRAQEEHRKLSDRKADELEQFAGRVAHDILSPLTAVSLALSIGQKGSGGKQVQSALDRGASSLLRVRRIVDGLLEFARAGALPEPGAVAEVAPIVAGIHDELSGLAEQENVELVVQPFPPCAARCSGGVLISLLSNLLRNALKYLGESQRREVTLRVHPRRGSVAFEVEDTGPGIPPSLGDKIFQPYVRGPRTGKPGIGLGLATVKRLVEAHGGSVGVHPAPGGGSVFWFDLPLAELPAVVAAAASQGA
jgi:signal transduction histidine kinase